MADQQAKPGAVTVAVDTEERTVDVPAELESVLSASGDARELFDSLSYTCRKEYARWVGEAKRAETRQRRAGLAQELKLAGVPLLVLDVQVAAIPAMKHWMKPQDQYVEITTHDNVMISVAESRAVLERLGIAGAILHTPGHSDDSVSLLLDDGSVFTGDLTHPIMVDEESRMAVSASWELLRRRGATRVYPGHGRVWPLS